MNFSDPADNATLRELQSQGVVDLNAYFPPRRGETIITALAREPHLVDEAKWLDWVTSNYRVYRLNKLVIDGDWIAALKFSREYSSSLVADTFLPICESAGTWIVACVRYCPEKAAAYAARWNCKILPVAPTIQEMREALAHYGYAVDL